VVNATHLAYDCAGHELGRDRLCARDGWVLPDLSPPPSAGTAPGSPACGTISLFEPPAADDQPTFDCFWAAPVAGWPAEL